MEQEKLQFNIKLIIRPINKNISGMTDIAIFNIKDKKKSFNGFFINRVLLTILILNLILNTFAGEKVTVDRLTNENRVLSSPIELHLISADSCLINSSVNLDHEDAWLFFDNVKPSVVISNYRSGIKINGTTLTVGGNGRVAIFGNGTVVMPFGSSFKPLTIFTEQNFKGDSIQLETDIYHNNLKSFDNAVKSFRLKRGYMATLANSNDGTGYSRVFIADNEDMNVGIIPAELNGTISFIRVFEYEWVSKKGKAGWNPNDIGATSYYDWNIGGSSSPDVEYVAIRQNGGWPSWSAINEKENVTHILGFNEPDHTDQANMTFQEMIGQWPEMMKSGYRIGSPAWANPWSGFGGNLFDFINKCDELNYRVDFVALHCYWGGKSPQNWYNDLKYIHEQTGRPLWITEWNNGANWTTEWWPDANKAYTDANARKQLNDLKGILQVLDTASFVERYFIYDWVQDCRAMVLNGKLTMAGEYYNANKSAIAFNKNKEIIPHWNYRNPELSYRYFSLRNSIRLSWTNPNDELIKKYILKKKVNNEDFKTVYSSDDISQLFYLDSLESAKEGNITFQMTFLTAEGEELNSNEVFYYQTTGVNEIQTGNFRLNNFDINTSFFSKKYATNPLVILGIPGFNNPAPLTQLVNNISVTTFSFYFKPWSYLSKPQLTDSDFLATMAMPSGTYDFGGLNAEAQAINGVSRDWISVEFNQQFETVPVVFSTLVSSKNPYPLTIAVRNVTKTGFELCLKSEESVTASLLTETINFLAVEPGNGTVDGKRITVGRNFHGNGISSTPIKITFDSTYSEPVIFAGLLSAENNFASTLRFSKIDDSSINIIKQREISGGESEINADDFGWMVMDIAANQPNIETSVTDKQMPQSFIFYPNPAKDIIYLNFREETKVEVLDITGQKLLEQKVTHILNIAPLPAGMYILKAKGKLSGKLIKIE